MIATKKSDNPLDYLPLGYVAFAVCPECGRMMSIDVTYGIPAEPIYCIADRDAILELPALISEPVDRPAQA